MGHSTQSWIVSIFAALLVHIMLFVVILYRANDDSIKKDELVEYSIDLTSFQAPPEKIENLKPVKTPPPAKKQAEPVQKKKPIQKKKIVKKKVVPKPQIALPEVDSKDVSEETSIQKPVVASKTNTLSNQGKTASKTTKLRDDEKAKYYNLILSKLKRLQKYPAMAQRRQVQGVAKLTFVLNKNGKLASYKLIQSTGSKLLDREVEALIKRATPFPPIPNSFGNGKLELTVPIVFVLK